MMGLLDQNVKGRPAMKRILSGIVLAAVVLAGCREGNGSQTSFNSREENPMETTSDSRTESETQDNIKAEFSHDSVYISLELPPDWEYEVKEIDETQEYKEGGIRFGPRECKDLRYELYYHSFYGICATGVTIEELQLQNGTNLWRYSETIEGNLWRNIVFEVENDAEERGRYVLDYYGDEELLMEYEEKLQEIMETVTVGK